MYQENPSQTNSQNPPEEQRFCKACNQYLGVSAFSRDRKVFKLSCRSCLAKRLRENRAKAKEAQASLKIPARYEDEAAALKNGLAAACGHATDPEAVPARLQELDAMPFLKREPGACDENTCGTCGRFMPLVACQIMREAENKEEPRYLCLECWKEEEASAKEGEFRVKMFRTHDEQTNRDLTEFWKICPSLPTPPRLGQVSPAVEKGMIPPGLSGGIDLEGFVQQVTNTEMRRAFEKLEGRERIPELADANDDAFASRIGKALKAGNYMQMNFYRPSTPEGQTGPLQAAYKAAAPMYSSVMKDAFQGHVDNCSSTLLLLGMEDAGTGWHRDGAEAGNQAFAADFPCKSKKRKAGDVWGAVISQGLTLAIWAFIIPGREADVAEFQEERFAKPFKHNCSLTVPQLYEMQRHFTDLEKPALLIYLQGHGDIVRVPPGWIHCVKNRQPCLKLAWELYSPVNFGLYFEALQNGGVKYFGKDNAADYMWVGAVLVKAIKILYRMAQDSDNKPT